MVYVASGGHPGGASIDQSTNDLKKSVDEASISDILHDVFTWSIGSQGNGGNFERHRSRVQLAQINRAFDPRLHQHQILEQLERPQSVSFV